MTNDPLEGLSPVMRRAYEALNSEKDREEFLEQTKNLQQSTVRNAIAAIMARNLSHGVGAHIGRSIKSTK